MLFKFFEGYDLQRICLDRVVVTVYDERYSIMNHRFDEEIAFQYPQYLKRVRIGKRSEDVIENANTFSSWSQRLRGPRTMVLRYNVIRAYKHHHSIEVKKSDILYEDNFYPVDFSPSLEDQLTLLYEAIERAKKLYHDQVLKFWGYECENVKATIKAIEIPFEIYPASTSDIFDQSSIAGINLYRYTTESNTMYFQEKDKTLDDKVKESFYQAMEEPSMVSNGFHSGLNGKIQLKIYQKIINLVRIEHTVYGDDIEVLFHMDKQTVSEDAEHIEMFLDSQFRERGLYFSRDDISLRRAVVALSRVSNIPLDTLKHLVNIETWTSTRDNKGMTRRLKRCGFIEKQSGTKRGYYRLTPEFKKMFEAFPEMDDELPTLIQSRTPDFASLKSEASEGCKYKKL